MWGILESFFHSLRVKLHDGSIAMCKEDLRWIVNLVEVDDKEIRICGREGEIDKIVYLKLCKAKPEDSCFRTEVASRTGFEPVLPP